MLGFLVFPFPARRVHAGLCAREVQNLLQGNPGACRPTSPCRCLHLAGEKSAAAARPAPLRPQCLGGNRI